MRSRGRLRRERRVGDQGFAAAGGDDFDGGRANEGSGAQDGFVGADEVVAVVTLPETDEL